MLKIKLNLIENPKFKNYNSNLKFHLQKENVLLDNFDFFILIAHIEDEKDIEIFKEYKDEKIGKIAIMHNSFEKAYEILNYVDRIIVHHKFQKDILLRMFIDSTLVIYIDYPIDYKKFINPPDSIKIYIPDDANDYEIINFLSENYEVVNEPYDSSIIVMAYKDEHFGNYHKFYELFGYSRVFLMPKFPQFMEFAILKATPEILYSNIKSLKIITEKLKDKWFYNYYLSISRAYAISNSFKRFSKQLLNVIRNVIPDDFLSLYI
jgi:hypothetical protein